MALMSIVTPRYTTRKFSIYLGLFTFCNIAHVKTTKIDKFILKNINYLLKKLYI